MRIKKKISFGIGLLFSLILILAVVSVEQINSLASDSENILKNNHQTVVYVKEMLRALNEFPVNPNSFEVIENYLAKQKNNITEHGERELTEHIEFGIKLLKTNPADSAVLKSIYTDLYEIMSLNLAAIQVKSSVATKTSQNSILWISILGSVCFLIALILLIKLPGNISNPIEELTESIQQISSKNYSQRVNFEDDIDFGDLAKSFNTMAKKLNEFNKSNLAQVISEKKITETLVNKIHDPIIGFDKNLNIIFVNDEFLRITDLSISNTVGFSVLELSQKNDLVSSIMIIDSLAEIESRNSNPFSKQIQLNRLGTEFYFEKEIQEISYIPIGEEVESLIGYVVILRNITKYMELDLAKTNFIATVSHEFKTPISSIKMSLQLLENERIGDLNDEQKKLLDGIFEDTERMLKTTGELLRMSQIESGKIQISMNDVDIKKVLQFAIEANKSLADLKNIRIDTSCPNFIPLVKADLDKMSWVLSNLVSNSLNYSEENSEVSISIGVTDTRVIISVTDKGKGIDSVYLDKIFDKYFRVPGIHQTQGTGLGLAICKEFIEAQDGQISVKSTIGEGSTFSISLNL
jgi:signal transduction histidine kinase